jgi:hypothetical protein
VSRLVRGVACDAPVKLDKWRPFVPPTAKILPKGAMFIVLVVSTAAFGYCSKSLCGHIAGGAIHPVRRDLLCDVARAEIGPSRDGSRVSGRDLRGRCTSYHCWGTGAVPDGNGVVTLTRCSTPPNGRWKAAISGMPRLQKAE